MSNLTIRPATLADLPHIVRILAADPVAGQRERFTEPLPAAYLRAFEAISADPNTEVFVAQHAEMVVGTYQRTYIPNLLCQGGWRAHIEAVMVLPSHRATGVGSHMMRHAIDQAKQRGCYLVQLTTNKHRERAHRFYQRLGFQFTHEGAKLILHPVAPSEDNL